MSRQYLSYLEESERNSLILDKKFNIECERIDIMLEIAERRSEIQIKEAELKVLTEGGTYEDLEYLYDTIFTEAEEQKKKMSIGERIQNLIDLVIKGIKGLFTGESSTIPKDTQIETEDLNKNKGILGAIKSFLQTLKNAIKTGGKAIISFAQNHKVLTGALAVFVSARSMKKNLFLDVYDDNKNDETNNASEEDNQEKNNYETTVGEVQSTIKDAEDCLNETSSIIDELDTVVSQYTNIVDKNESKIANADENFKQLVEKYNNELADLDRRLSVSANHTKRNKNGVTYPFISKDDYLRAKNEIEEKIQELEKEHDREVANAKKANETAKKNIDIRINKIKDELESKTTTVKNINTMLSDYSKIEGTSDSGNDGGGDGTTSSDTSDKGELEKAHTSILNHLLGFVKWIKNLVKKLSEPLAKAAKKLGKKITKKLNKNNKDKNPEGNADDDDDFDVVEEEDTSKS